MRHLRSIASSGRDLGRLRNENLLIAFSRELTFDRAGLAAAMSGSVEVADANCHAYAKVGDISDRDLPQMSEANGTRRRRICSEWFSRHVSVRYLC